MAVIRLNHHDFPEALKAQIEKKFGTGTVSIRKINHWVAEIEFDEREAPWRYYGSVGRAIQGLEEENEWIINTEHIG